MGAPVPVSEVAVRARLVRSLEADGLVLRRARSPYQSVLHGRWFLQRGPTIVSRHVDLAFLARVRGCLQPWETINE
jgi:hypothetical protein